MIIHIRLKYAAQVLNSRLRIAGARGTVEDDSRFGNMFPLKLSCNTLERHCEGRTILRELSTAKTPQEPGMSSAQEAVRL